MGHFGIGSNQNNTTQKANVAFSEYKARLDLEAHLHYKLNFTHVNLSKEDKEKIKDKIRKQQRKVNIKTGVISIVLFIGVAYVAIHLITQIVSR